MTARKTTSSGDAERLRTRIALAILLLLIAILLIGGYVLSGYVVPDTPTPTPAPPQLNIAPQVDATAPDISIPQLDNGTAGPRVSLSSLRGHPVILNFWATWCQPCLAELPALDAVYRKYHASNGLQVIGVNVQDGSTPAQIASFTNKLNVTFPIWLSGATDYNVEVTYKIQGMPTTAFIDRSGVIRQIRIGGPMTQAYLEGQLDKLIQE